MVEYYGAPPDEVLRTKPTASRSRYLKKVTVSTTTNRASLWTRRWRATSQNLVPPYAPVPAPPAQPRLQSGNTYALRCSAINAGVGASGEGDHVVEPRRGCTAAVRSARQSPNPSRVPLTSLRPRRRTSRLDGRRRPCLPCFDPTPCRTSWWRSGTLPAAGQREGGPGSGRATDRAVGGIVPSEFRVPERCASFASCGARNVGRQPADALGDLRRDVLPVNLEAEALLDDRDQLDHCAKREVSHPQSDQNPKHEPKSGENVTRVPRVNDNRGVPSAMHHS
jgi:hypothetical protein